MSVVDSEAQREILDLLVARSPLHVMDIAETTGHHPITVDQICTHLYEQGYISPLGRGLYKLTEDGKQQVRSEEAV